MQPLIVVHTDQAHVQVHPLIAALYQQTVRQLDVLIVATTPPSDLSRVQNNFPVTYHELPAGSTVATLINEACARHPSEYVVTLDAGAMPRDSQWLMHLLKHFRDEEVAAVSGADYDLARVSVRAPEYSQDLLDFLAAPHYGLSFASGAFRRDLWRQQPFDASNATCADKQWAYHWLREGYRVTMDFQARCHPGRERSEEERFRRYWFMSLSFGAFIQPREDLKGLLQSALRAGVRRGSLEPLARLYRLWGPIHAQHYWKPDSIHAMLARQHFRRTRDEWAV